MGDAEQVSQFVESGIFFTCEARETHPTLEGQPKHLHLASLMTLMTSINATSVSQSIYPY